LGIDARAWRAVICVLALGCGAPAAIAAEATVEVPMRDPWVPPELAKKARAAPASSGVELRQEVERKLRARFEDAAPSGSLTRAEARAAGLGFIDRHFEAIDRRHVGRVSFEDYRRFLVERGALLE
jgi:hypothetical protein